MSYEEQKLQGEINILKHENERLRKEALGDYHEGWEEGYAALKADNERLNKENQKLRDALAFIQCKAQDTLRPVPFQEDE